MAVSGAPVNRADNPLAYDLLTMLCCILDEVGPVEVTDAQQIKVQHSELTITEVPHRDALVLVYGRTGPALLEADPPSQNGTQTPED